MNVQKPSIEQRYKYEEHCAFGIRSCASHIWHFVLICCLKARFEGFFLTSCRYHWGSVHVRYYGWKEKCLLLVNRYVRICLYLPRKKSKRLYRTKEEQIEMDRNESNQEYDNFRWNASAEGARERKSLMTCALAKNVILYWIICARTSIYKYR